MKKVVLILLFTLIALTSCQNKDLTSNDEKSIEQFNKTWNDNILSGNRVANANLFTDDGVRIEGGKTYNGKDEIRSLFSKQTVQRIYIRQENKIQKIWSSMDFITTEIIQTQVYLNNETGDTITKKSAAIAIFIRNPDDRSLKLAYNLKTELTE